MSSENDEAGDENVNLLEEKQGVQVVLTGVNTLHLDDQVDSRFRRAANKDKLFEVVFIR